MKKFTRIRQWAEEKISKPHGNLPSEEFKDFQMETKRRHEDYDGLRHTMNLALRHMKKSKVASDNGQLKSPVGDYGESLLGHASMFPRDCVYWNILTSFGLGECQLSEAEGALAEDTVDNYIALLQEFNVGYKRYQSLCRKLESRRLDYDAKYKRLQKAKKEDPETEQCVQAAKVKFEETELDVVTSMISLQGTEEQHCDALQTLLDSQLAYHRKATSILENVGYEWNQWKRNCDSDGVSPLTSKCAQLDACEGVNGAYKPMLRRALYDHIQNQDDELSFHVNDIITVLHKVDDSWWLGEIINKDNKRTRGIFPVNYTEKYIEKDSDNAPDTTKKDEQHSTNDVDDVKSTSLKRIPHHLERINTRRPPAKRSSTDWSLSPPPSPSSISSFSPTSIQSVMGSLPSSSTATLPPQTDDREPLAQHYSPATFTAVDEGPPTPAKTSTPQRQSSASSKSSQHSIASSTPRSTVSSQYYYSSTPASTRRRSPGIESAGPPTPITTQQKPTPIKTHALDLPPPTNYYGRPLPPRPSDDD
ncbi:hypothetical protein [Absidia glauca]|uniref:SH3 domain-containing protein n=1 Tax=Absidia glauca TaxID=4829 RepID=A0A163JVV8_ABSGL|nr:hypothetical protein [Absidia glauca]